MAYTADGLSNRLRWVNSYCRANRLQELRFLLSQIGVRSDGVDASQAEDLIRAKTRKQEIVNARQIAMYLTKELTNSSLKTIGLHFGGRDHSTVIHAYQTVEDSMKTDPKQKSLVHLLRSKLERNVQ